MIPLDGRKHREDMEPSFYGDPVGHWEGDTLVIETTNFKRWSLDDYFYTNPNESRMHSDALKTIEQIAGRDAEDAVVQPDHRRSQDLSARPWSQEFSIKARPEWEQPVCMEYVCEENNRCPGGKCQGH